MSDLYVKNDLYCRMNTTDECTIAQVREDYYQLEFENQICLDIGANIGAFARFALNHGAKKVYSYEPHPGNFEMLKKNQRGLMETYQVAIAKSVLSRYLYIKQDGFESMHSITKKWGVKAIKVCCIPIMQPILEYQPTILKIDIEGAEHELFNYKQTLPQCIKQVAIELHNFTLGDIRKSQELLRWLIDQNFKYIRTPLLTEEHDSTICIMQRK